MSRIITIPNDNDSVMNSERQRIVPWAPRHGWIYVGYNDQNDHIAQIRRVSGGSAIELLDIDCHGSPTSFDHTSISSAYDWAQNLQKNLVLTSGTMIFLDACNTGLSSAYGGPIAQVVADGANCRVWGTKGYMTGTLAEGNEKCYASYDGLPSYPGAQDASGRNVWLAFRPQSLLNPEDMNEQISLNIKPDQEDTKELISTIESIIKSQPIDFPSLRMAPDITLNYQTDSGAIILDVYANGGLLKDRILNKAWKVNNPEQFQVLVLNLLSK